MKIPARKVDREAFLEEFRQEAYNKGYTDGAQAMQARMKKEPEILRLEALKAITAYASATGQTIAAFSQAMQSERGQL